MESDFALRAVTPDGVVAQPAVAFGSPFPRLRALTPDGVVRKTVFCSWESVRALPYNPLRALPLKPTRN